MISLIRNKRITLSSSFFNSPIRACHTNNQGDIAPYEKSPLKIPGPYYFRQLKEEEKKQFPHKDRMRFNYNTNYSAAFALPYSQTELRRAQYSQEKLLELSKQLIIEHANRRVDLFFYTLMAYYKTGFFPTSGHTDLQHGKGRNNNHAQGITEACHSSILPSLVDKTIYQNKNGTTKYKSLLTSTHFSENLNSTVELPSFVNRFDNLLEEKCRIQCLNILRRVTSGAINPIEGLNAFLLLFDNLLHQLKHQASNKASFLMQHSLLKQPKLNVQLIDLVIEGTLSRTFSPQTKQATDYYIQLLLRLKPEEKVLCQSNDLCRKEIYENKMKELQQEILQTDTERPYHWLG